MAARPRFFRLDTPERWRVASSPVRQRLIQLMEDEQWWTVRDLASFLGRDTHALYHHLEKMREVGMVELDELEDATRFRLLGRVIATGHRHGEPFEAFFKKTVERMMKEAARIHSGRPASTDEELTGLLSGWTLNLTRAQAAKLRATVQSFVEQVQTAQRASLSSASPASQAEERSPYHVLIGFTPFDSRVRGPDGDD